MKRHHRVPQLSGDVPGSIVSSHDQHLNRDVRAVGVDEVAGAALQATGHDLAAVRADAKLGRFGEFWSVSEAQFVRRATEHLGPLTSSGLDHVRAAYRKAKGSADARWHLIVEAEQAPEDAVQKAYRVSDRVYEAVIDGAPSPKIAWALRP